MVSVVEGNFLQILITKPKLLPKEPANEKNDEIQVEE